MWRAGVAAAASSSLCSSVPAAAACACPGRRPASAEAERYAAASPWLGLRKRLRPGQGSRTPTVATECSQQQADAASDPVACTEKIRFRHLAGLAAVGDQLPLTTAAGKPKFCGWPRRNGLSLGGLCRLPRSLAAGGPRPSPPA